MRSTRPIAQNHDTRWNFSWISLSGALHQFGAAFIDTGTVIAAFVGGLTSSAFAVGAAESIARFGWLLPQLFVARFAQELRFRKPIYLVSGWGRAILLALLAMVLLFVGGKSGGDTSQGMTIALPLTTLFFLLWTLFSFVSGIAGVPYNDIVARVIPSNLRSRLLGVRFFVGGVLAVVAGFFIRIIFRKYSPFSPYGIIFATGAIVLALSTTFFALVREPPAFIVRPRQEFTAFLREGRRVLREDKRFRQFLHVQILTGLTTMAIPFYVVQARQVNMLAEAEVGSMVVAQMLGGLLLNPIWGWWGDRKGKLSLLKAVAVAGAVSPLLAILLSLFPSPSQVMVIFGYGATFFFLGATLSGGIIADLGYLMEISPDDQRPEYSGYMNTLVAPTRLLPLIAGMLVEAVSFRFVFSLAFLVVPARLALLVHLEVKDWRMKGNEHG